jgi:hypothetical protein
MVAMAAAAALNGRIGCRRIRGAATTAGDHRRDAMMAHLAKLQGIANANDGSRALGTPGYDASVDYVVETLRGKGFDVQTREFEVHLPFADDPALTVDGTNIPANPLEFAIGTPPQGVSGPLVPARVEGTPRLQRRRLWRAARRRCGGSDRPRRVPVRREAGRRRTWRSGPDCRQQCR